LQSIDNRSSTPPPSPLDLSCYQNSLPTWSAHVLQTMRPAAAWHPCWLPRVWLPSTGNCRLPRPNWVVANAHHLQGSRRRACAAPHHPIAGAKESLTHPAGQHADDLEGPRVAPDAVVGRGPRPQQRSHHAGCEDIGRGGAAGLGQTDGGLR